MFKIMIGVIVVAAIVIVGFMIIDPKVNATNINMITEVVDGSGVSNYRYTIEGEVNKPGSYALQDTVTIGDLIAAAGGVTANADDFAYYEDSVIKSGSTYYIASKYNANDICNTEEIAKVNINADDADTLMSVNGITSSIASSIVSYRTGNGYFKTIEQLMEVYGVGNATYRKIRNFVILHNQ